MRKKFLVFGSPVLGKQEEHEIIDTLRSGWWGTGPKTEIFERLFAEYSHAKHALAVNSATAGLHLALKALGIGPGDEVITTPLTFCSTVNVIEHCRALPVFADVDPDTWNINPVEIKKKISKRTKAILPVHLHGRPCDMDSIMSIAKKHNLVVIEDAAHAIEAWYKKKKIGSISHVTVFSFYVTKNLSTAEGGMITTNNLTLANTMRILSLHGLSRDAYKRYSIKHFRHYECLVPGFKYNMTDIQASLGIHQLARIEKNAGKRNTYWNMYNAAFKNIPQLILPAHIPADIVHALHLYAIRLKPRSCTLTRNQFVNELIRYNIGSGIHFTPVHLHPYYKKTYGYRNGDYPHAERVGNSILSLPLGANLTKQDIHDVIDAVLSIIQKHTI